MAATFSELNSTGLIAVRGADAASFLQAQLTSDISRMTSGRTHYSGYCSPKGRLLATFFVWRLDEVILLQLPHALLDSVMGRLSRYILRAQVKLEPAAYRLFGVWGGREDKEEAAALAAVAGSTPHGDHEILSSPPLHTARLPLDRFLVLAPATDVSATRAALGARAQAQPESAWARLDIEAGVPVITAETQDQHIPQAVNLDLIGGVSYSKGCYPGQEIVARTHYLGRVKQRMYRVKVPGGSRALPGDALYSAAFGAEQASGTLLNVAPAAKGETEALAVLQTQSARDGTIHWKTADGPVLELQPLPYAIPQ